MKSNVFTGQNKHAATTSEDRRSSELNKPKSPEDKLSILKAHIKAKGLCFKCGEKWNPQHKYSSTVSLNAIEEVWEMLSENLSKPLLSFKEEVDSDDELMALSLQAIKGTEGVKTIRLRGFVADQEVFMLVDSSSSHSFMNQHLATVVKGWKKLDRLVQVRVANGNEISCTDELLDLLWSVQGNTFKSSFKIIPLGCYDIVLGMDWLSLFSPMEIHWADKWLKF